MPTVSVLMSVYNGEEFLEESIDSLLNQTYKDFEVIIVNDGSVDQTRQILDSYEDSRLRVYHLTENVGVGGALKFGLLHAHGKYVAKADADDINHPSRIQKQVEYLEANPNISLVKTLIEYFPHNEEVANSNRYKSYKSFREDFKNSVTLTEELSEKIYWTCCIPHTAIMAKRSVLEEVGYDATLRVAEDYKLFYELNKLGYLMGTVEEVLVRVRVSDQSTTVLNHSIFWESVYKIKKQEIVALFGEDNRVFLWGAGLKGESILKTLLADGLSVSGFIDSDPNKQNRMLSGFKVYSPDILRSGDKVLITSQPGLYSIGRELKRRGFNNLKDFIGFY